MQEVPYGLCSCVVICMQETSDSSSDQKFLQQSSEIMMLKSKLEKLRKEKKQLIDIHSKCKSRNEISVSTQSDEVCIYSVCMHTSSYTVIICKLKMWNLILYIIYVHTCKI